MPRTVTMLPNRFCFMANPHTASQSVREAMKHQLPCIKQGQWRGGARLVESPLTGNEIWFSVVRNPHDVLATRYHREVVAVGGDTPIETFVAEYDREPFITGGKFWPAAHICDRVIRFENLQADLDGVMDEVGPWRIALGHRGATGGKRPWRSYFTREALSIVAERFGDENNTHFPTGEAVDLHE